MTRPNVGLSVDAIAQVKLVKGKNLVAVRACSISSRKIAMFDIKRVFNRLRAFVLS